MHAVHLPFCVLLNAIQRWSVGLALTLLLLLLLQLTTGAQSVRSDSKADTTVTSAKDIPAVAPATATDNCDSKPTVYFKQKVVDSTHVNNFKLIRKWWAEDACGNISDTITQVITVHDNIEPAPGITTIAPVTDPKVAAQPGKTTLDVTVFPNPYNDKLVFRFIAPTTGLTKLEVYNVLGQQIGQLNYGMVGKDTQHTIEYLVPSQYRDILLYRLNVGEYFKTGKAIPAKK
ncbi:T9SS type A sorting domain-containing protein [Chitinophaga filiformis]|uniref:T9SS type A sorting domain-containing protein n=1 Tax=Chitinophaga filiformis TaxID=104663 RepID=UPI001F378D53|nr:T9SS type A sorting domain-containing protein [Chitinophaga filiformis]MCF6407304.1 T9SS type A sorting domain-containing protein [Chitinophaga filiformis]